MSVTRIVPNLLVTNVARANEVYSQIFGLDVGMDLGWVGNLAPADAPAVQLQVMTSDESAPCNPAISVGVTAPAEVDAIHDRVVAAGLEIVHPVSDEDWGVHRFFFRDHDGNVVNVVALSMQPGVAPPRLTDPLRDRNPGFAGRRELLGCGSASETPESSRCPSDARRGPALGVRSFRCRCRPSVSPA